MTTHPPIPRLVGITEAAAILGWSRQRASIYNRRGKLPAPLQRLSTGPVWTAQQIEEYRDSINPAK